MVVLRGETIKCSSQKKKKVQKLEKEHENTIQNLERQLNTNFNDTILEEVDIKKSQLQNLRKQRIDGVLTRAKCRYENLGEKPTKYLFGLEKKKLYK